MTTTEIQGQLMSAKYKRCFLQEQYERGNIKAGTELQRVSESICEMSLAMYDHVHNELTAAYQQRAELPAQSLEIEKLDAQISVLKALLKTANQERQIQFAFEKY